MSNAERIDAERARERVRSGEALLVCAYEDEEKCRKLGLEEALTLAELQARDVPRDRELVFFCA
ncbi:MAG TPA: ArsR family transcriptional regulator [Thermoanaerobaculia bacterium]|nr:ArsR family transcriptional regulator [Thermoanaerobaculia bacterium]